MLTVNIKLEFPKHSLDGRKNMILKRILSINKDIWKIICIHLQGYWL